MVLKVEVMKSKPETKCERVPREFCRKEACDPEEGRDECYFRNQVVSDARQSTAWYKKSVASRVCTVPSIFKAQSFSPY